MNLDFIKNKKILITGATGSIGSSLVFRLIESRCKVLRVMSNDENGLYELSRKIIKKFTIDYDLFINQMGKNRIRFFLGDVRDKKRCDDITKDVDIVIHAAAIKHVNIAEYNSAEALKTNYDGTKNIFKASIKNDVSKFIFISTDKVVSPTNIMGKSKLLAENFVINSKKLIGSKKLKVSSIRFGNVVGSRGSVIPNFISSLDKKQNIFVTSKKMTRFVMTVEDSVNSILSVLSIMKGYEIFILKSMKCFKIIDLANALLFYYKKKGNKKSKIIISEEGKGEKFEEELFREKDIQKITIKKKMFVIKNKIINNNANYINKINNYRVSNFNFMSQKQIIKMLKNLSLLS
jgi:UDP-N-acetylglucosamine 4,6-dehydratase/5-epimerase